MEANPTTLRQMLLNLILNAAEATEGKGIIEILIRQTADTALIEVHDNGPGIPLEKRPTLFTAFYTAKSQSAGLGLLSVKVYVELHQGHVEILDSHLGGTCIRITLPIGKRRETSLFTEFPLGRLSGVGSETYET